MTMLPLYIVWTTQINSNYSNNHYKWHSGKNGHIYWLIKRNIGLNQSKSFWKVIFIEIQQLLWYFNWYVIISAILNGILNHALWSHITHHHHQVPKSLDPTTPRAYKNNILGFSVPTTSGHEQGHERVWEHKWAQGCEQACL